MLRTPRGEGWCDRVLSINIGGNLGQDLRSVLMISYLGSRRWLPSANLFIYRGTNKGDSIEPKQHWLCPVHSLRLYVVADKLPTNTVWEVLLGYVTLSCNHGQDVVLILPPPPGRNLICVGHVKLTFAGTNSFNGTCKLVCERSKPSSTFSYNWSSYIFTEWVLRRYISRPSSLRLQSLAGRYCGPRRRRADACCAWNFGSAVGAGQEIIRGWSLRRKLELGE